MNSETQTTGKQKRKKKLEEYNQTEPEQLALVFRLDEEEKEQYSNSIELYDFMPKYVWNKVERIQGQFLSPIKRYFECRGEKYTLVIKPASIEEEGVFRHYFPSVREELVEDALRKVACENSGVFLDDESAVTFTLYQLKKGLEDRKHGYNIVDIKKALYILSETHLELSTKDGGMVMKSNMLSALGLQAKEGWKGNGKKIKAFAIFNPMVTLAIKATKFRRLNYSTCMSINNVIARQLYKRMVHHYTQASIVAEPYTILLSTMIRDFGLTQYSELRNNLREVVQALEYLILTDEKKEDSKEKNKKVDVIQSYKVEKIINSSERNKLIDAKFIIQTSVAFNTEVRKANQIAKEKVLPDYKVKHHQLDWTSTIHGKKKL